jgi:DNA-binding transcriptional MerR regulator
MKLLDFFKRLLKLSPRTHQGQRMSSQDMQNLLHRLEKTQEEEYSCDEAHELMDQFAEMVMRGEDAAQIMPLVQHHLEMCPDCAEELEALLTILEGTQTPPGT